MEWKGNKIEEGFIERLKQLHWKRQRVANEIRNLVSEFRRRRPDFRQGSLYLSIQEHRPPCPSCPHGPYWYQAMFTRHRKWIGRYVGRRLNKTFIYKTWNYREVNFLLEFDQKAHELREKKRAVSRVPLSLKGIFKKAGL